MAGRALELTFLPSVLPPNLSWWFMSIFRAFLLSVVAAGALALPWAEQLGAEQVWEVSEIEDGAEVDDDADGPVWIELQVHKERSVKATAADLEPVALKSVGSKTSLERPPRG